MAKKTGLEGAFSDDGEKPGRSIGGGEPEQPALIEAAELEAEAAASHEMFGFSLDRSKGGRPPGSRNRSTAETKRFLQALGADPVIAAARVVRGGPNFVFEQAQTMEREVQRNIDGELTTITEAGLDPDKAWSIWLRCVEFLGPYVHSKQPIDVNVDQPGLAIQINVGSPDAAAQIEAAAGGRRRFSLDTEKSDTCEDEGEEVTRGEGHTDAPDG